VNGWLKRGITGLSAQIETNPFSRARADRRPMASHRYQLQLGCALQRRFSIMNLELMHHWFNFVFKLYLIRLSACRGAAGYLESAILHFLKVTNSY